MQITDISLLPQFSATMEAIMQFNDADETISDNIFYDVSSIRRLNIKNAECLPSPVCLDSSRNTILRTKLNV